MLRVLVRRSSDVRYFTSDHGLELEGLREGPAGWWLRGAGDAHDEHEVAHVLTSTAKSGVVGYDLIFAAPRPLSILLALDAEHARAIVALQRRAVRGALSYLEEHSLVVRDRRGGDDRQYPAHWERAVSFTHGVNRHGEPHLHDHVLVGARPADRDVVLDSRALFAHARAADALYRTSLRFELARRTPYQSLRTFAGGDAVADLDEGYRALWGGRHDTRGEKHLWTRDEIVERWRRDRERYEPTLKFVSRVAPSRTLDEHRFGATLEGRYEVARRHVVEAWSDAAITGVDSRALQASVDLLYPELANGRGVRERTIGVAQARQGLLVRERGPRPLGGVELEQWRQRSRSRTRSGEERSR